MDTIRNFSIVAHIDHGKSTLADRMLEVTGTVEKRKMKEQVLDSMDLERERGITIKMQPVRMSWTPPGAHAPYVFNLIDTPGHIDFAYEVSRALKAVEGVVLLVDATQGIQAQTLATLEMARAAGCVVVPAVSKIDAPSARTDEVVLELAALLTVPFESVCRVSGKTGEGVENLLAAIIERVPPPRRLAPESESARALVFDFSYSEHRGITMFVRVFDGALTARMPLELAARGVRCSPLEVGYFTPGEVSAPRLGPGEIGYVVSGIKEPGTALVGDTLRAPKGLEALPGYQEPKPVVWASLYPESQDDFTLLKHALERLKLSDAALSFEEDGSNILGKGFRCGFLGMLHMEIITERLKREHGIEPVITAPTIQYDIVHKSGSRTSIFSPAEFPEPHEVVAVFEQWTRIRIITPPAFHSVITQLLYEFEAVITSSDLFSDGRMSLGAEMPLRELMRGFFDRLKSASSGFASLSYEPLDVREAQVTRLEVLVAEELVPAFSRIVSRKRVQEDAKALVEKLFTTLPKQLFVVKIQAKADGRIIASRTLSALRKDVTGYLYGGDVTRKKKLLEKQKKGKERRAAHARVNIPQEIFLKMVRPDD